MKNYETKQDALNEIKNRVGNYSVTFIHQSLAKVHGLKNGGWYLLNAWNKMA